MRDHRRQRELEHRPTGREDTDGGFTLIEVLIAVLLLGILATVVVVAASGMRTDAAESGCASDARILAVAAETYFAHTDSDTIPATGADHDRYERTLADGGYVRAASQFYDLDADGVATPQEDSPC